MNAMEILLTCGAALAVGYLIALYVNWRESRAKKQAPPPPAIDLPSPARPRRDYTPTAAGRHRSLRAIPNSKRESEPERRDSTLETLATAAIINHMINDEPPSSNYHDHGHSHHYDSGSHDSGGGGSFGGGGSSDSWSDSGGSSDSGSSYSSND